MKIRTWLIVKIGWWRSLFKNGLFGLWLCQLFTLKPEARKREEK